MSNDRNDFAPEIRNSAWWASDTRQAINGHAVETILIKQGKQPPPDLSEVEAVQMGHIMQPTIGRLASQKLKMELKDADYHLTHSSEPWFRSHFDFINAGGNVLVEAKNYSASVRNKFDPDTNRIPPADYAQIVHEAAVHKINTVYLAVLFGGQEFHTFKFEISDQEKEDLIKKMAVYWGHVKAGTTPEPQTIEETKLVYTQSTDGVIVATSDLERAIGDLKAIKGKIKELEAIAEQWEVQVRNAMSDNAEIRTFDGNTLVTWKSSKASMRFSADLFKSAMPDIYKKFIVEQDGSRRFLIK
jgi:predicted phage-related endonuclease